MKATASRYRKLCRRCLENGHQYFDLLLLDVMMEISDSKWQVC